MTRSLIPQVYALVAAKCRGGSRFPSAYTESAPEREDALPSASTFPFEQHLLAVERLPFSAAAA